MSKTGFFVVLLVFVNFFLAIQIFDGQTGLPAYNDLKDKISTINTRIEDIDAQNRQLSSEIRVVKKDDKYIERLVKRELFYVAENETMYIFK
ncbi:MAG: septum formation initiator family protein [Deltaproteobacteria bacterium]|nr:septum formation initiator family protein [Deltaproteobacteria bacterium]